MGRINNRHKPSKKNQTRRHNYLRRINSYEKRKWREALEAEDKIVRSLQEELEQVKEDQTAVAVLKSSEKVWSKRFERLKAEFEEKVKEKVKEKEEEMNRFWAREARKKEEEWRKAWMLRMEAFNRERFEEIESAKQPILEERVRILREKEQLEKRVRELEREIFELQRNLANRGVGHRTGLRSQR